MNIFGRFNKASFIYLFLFCLTYSTISAQNLFKKNYEYAILQNFNCYELTANRYLTSIAGISKIGGVGNLETSRILINPSSFYDNTLLKQTDNLFYVSGYTRMNDTICYGDTNSALFFLTKMDTAFNVLKRKAFTLDFSCVFNQDNMFSTSGDGIISVGYGIKSCGTSSWCIGDPYALCVDSSLNVIWAKRYTNNTGGIQFAKQTKDGQFLLGFNFDKVGAVVAKTDASGNILWCKSYIRPKGFLHDCLIEPDGSFIITGFTDSVKISIFGTYPVGFAPKLFMMKIDSVGSILWAKVFDSDKHWLMRASKIIKTNDSNYAILASVGYIYGSIKPLIIKTDGNGDTLWTRIHGRGKYFFEGINFIETSDKGFLVGGNEMGSIPGTSGTYWLYKLDSLAHGECHELEQPLNTNTIFATDSNIVIMAINSQTQEYDTPKLLDTNYPQRQIWDDCSINYVPFINRDNYSIRPNPSVGIIHIYRDNSYLSDCYYSVYDNSGRLLVQKSFTMDNKDELVDLSKFGKGIYLIKILDGIEMLTKKIVIE